jgi:hypothetical protein
MNTLRHLALVLALAGCATDDAKDTDADDTTTDTEDTTDTTDTEDTTEVDTDDTPQDTDTPDDTDAPDDTDMGGDTGDTDPPAPQLPGRTDVGILTFSNGLNGGAVEVFPSTGSGLADGQGWTPSSGLPENVADRELLVADFDGDGDNDAGVFTYSNGLNSGAFEMFLSTGSGFADGAGWTPQSGFPVSETDRQLMLGDVDGDGDDDLGVLTWSNGLNSGFFELFSSTGSGFADGTSWTPFSGFPENDDDRQAVLGDFDGDGDADLALVTWSNGLNSGSVEMFLATGSRFGDGTGWTPLSGLPVNDDDRRLLVGDYDGDGDSDLAVVTYSNGFNGGAVEMFLSTGSGFADGRGRTPSSGLPPAASDRQLIPGDFDGDGETDLGVLTYSNGLNGGAVEMFLSTGAGFADGAGWTPASPLPEPQADRQVMLGDFDGM